MTEIGYLLLMLCSSGPAGVLSTRVQCFTCLRDCWCSISMAPVLQEGVEPVCLGCARVKRAEMGVIETALHPRQIDELTALGLAGFAAEFVEFVNRGGKF